jgi:hypothetical protein
LLKTQKKHKLGRFCLLACFLPLPSLLASFLGFGYFWLDLLPLVFVDLFAALLAFAF